MACALALGWNVQAAPLRDLVEVRRLDPTLRLDIRYATANNFLRQPLYSQPRAFLQRPAAQALVQAHKTLQKSGYDLVVWDAYRPWSITRLMAQKSPPEWIGVYVADPARGSRHNRGCAVDVTLWDIQRQRLAAMPTEYDDFTTRAGAFYPAVPRPVRERRALLQKAMTDAGFKTYEAEWWHFDYADWPRYPILDIDFETLNARSAAPAP